MTHPLTATGVVDRVVGQKAAKEEESADSGCDFGLAEKGADLQVL